jgi:hypothetical protein
LEGEVALSRSFRLELEEAGFEVYLERLYLSRRNEGWLLGLLIFLETAYSNRRFEIGLAVLSDEQRW